MMQLKKIFFISITSIALATSCVTYDEILDTFSYSPATEAIDYIKYLEKEEAAIETVYNQESKK